MKGANSYMEILLVVFREKIHLANLIFLVFRPFFTVWLGMVKLRQVTINSQDLISFMITTGSLNSQDTIRIFKQSRHDFSGKHSSDRYFMDICDFYVWRSKFMVL